AVTYPYVTVNEMTGETIKTILEDVADNLFNPDPYYQQGGDMVRVGGLRYAIDPGAAMGRRITSMTLAGKPLDAAKKYKVAGWALWPLPPHSVDSHASKLSLARLHDDGAAGSDDEPLVRDDVAIGLEPALSDETQRLGRRFDDARLLCELRDRKTCARCVQRH